MRCTKFGCVKNKLKQCFESVHVLQVSVASVVLTTAVEYAAMRFDLWR